MNKSGGVDHMCSEKIPMELCQINRKGLWIYNKSSLIKCKQELNAEVAKIYSKNSSSLFHTIFITVYCYNHSILL